MGDGFDLGRLRLAPLSEITGDDISPAIGVAQEDLHLEFKQAPFVPDAEGQMKLLKEVAAMANAEGGVILIGVVEDKERRAVDLRSVPDPGSEIGRMRDLCSSRIEPPLPALEMKSVKVGDCDIIIVRVLGTTKKPHSIVIGSQRRFVRRFVDHVRDMSYADLREEFLGDRILQELSQIRAEIAGLRGVAAPPPTPPADDREALDITAEPEFRKYRRMAFLEQIEGKPAYRLTATPMPLRGDRPLREHRDQLRKLISSPPGARKSGWTLEPHGEIRSEPAAMVGENPYAEAGVRIMWNGHTEYWAGLRTRAFQWNYLDLSEPRPFYLELLAIIEPVVGLVRLLNELVPLLGDLKEFRVGAEFLNARGAMLIKYPPQSMGHRMVLSGDPLGDGVREIKGDHLGIDEVSLGRDELNEAGARRVVKEIYHAFGFESFEIPFLKKDGTFTV